MTSDQALSVFIISVHRSSEITFLGNITRILLAPWETRRNIFKGKDETIVKGGGPIQTTCTATLSIIVANILLTSERYFFRSTPLIKKNISTTTVNSPILKQRETAKRTSQQQSHRMMAPNLLGRPL